MMKTEAGRNGKVEAEKLVQRKSAHRAPEIVLTNYNVDMRIYWRPFEVMSVSLELPTIILIKHHLCI
jgi:hypothetical protein